MPDEWADDWDDADDSDDEPLPPAYYNADAELARELDISRVWEPAALKFTETPFTIANRQRREEGVKAVKAVKGKERAKAKSGQTWMGKEVVASAWDDQEAPGPSRLSTSTLNTKKGDPPPPPPVPRRRGPVPAKSGKLFGVDPAEEKKETVKKATKKWTRAEVDGWKDASGNPIPSTKIAGGKKGAAAAKAKKSIVDMLNEMPEKPKGGKVVKGKGKKGAEARVEAAGAGVELPDIPDVPVKKKRAPRKKKEVEEGDGELEKVVKKGKAAGRKKKVEEEIEVVEVEDDEEEEKVVVKSDCEVDSLDGLLRSRKRGKARVDATDDDGQTPPKRSKGSAVTAGLTKGKGKAREEDKSVRFSRLPAGAEPTDKFPIVKLLEHQKTLPIKSKPNPAPKSKPKPKSTKANPKPTPLTIPSSSSQMGEDDAAALINSLMNGTDITRITSIDELIPKLGTTHLLKRKKVESEGGESIDPEEAESDDDVRVNMGSEVDDEEEGKKAVMSRYFDNQADAGGGSDGPIQTAPTTLDYGFSADTSSAIPAHSSPTEKRAVRRQDSKLVHPQPIRRIPLPNAAKYEHLAKLAEKGKEDAKSGSGRKKETRDVPDITSYMSKGLTISQDPMSVKRAHRPRSPQPQIESRLRGPVLQPLKPNRDNTDMFRSPAYKRKLAAGASSDIEGEDVKPTPWGTLPNKRAGTKKGMYTPYDYDPTSTSHRYRGNSPSASAKTITQLAKPKLLFTPQPPKPEITIPTPKFRTKTNLGTGQYGSEASTRATEAVRDPYKRARKDDGMGVMRFARDRQSTSPEVETLRGQKGTVYTIRKSAQGENGNGGRPRYMPATAVTMGQAGKGAGDEDDRDDWKAQWKFQPRNAVDVRDEGKRGAPAVVKAAGYTGQDRPTSAYEQREVSRTREMEQGEWGDEYTDLDNQYASNAALYPVSTTGRPTFERTQVVNREPYAERRDSSRMGTESNRFTAPRTSHSGNTQPSQYSAARTSSSGNAPPPSYHSHVQSGVIRSDQPSRGEWRVPFIENNKPEFGIKNGMGPIPQTSSSGGDRFFAPVGPIDTGRGRTSRVSLVDEREEERNAPVESIRRSHPTDFGESHHAHQASTLYSSQQATNGTSAAHSHFDRADNGHIHNSYHPRSTSYNIDIPVRNEQTSLPALGKSRLGRIPMATFNGSKSRLPPPTAYEQPTNMRKGGRREAPRVNTRKEEVWGGEYSESRGGADSGPSTYGGYESRTEAVYEAYDKGQDRREDGWRQGDEESMGDHRGQWGNGLEAGPSNYDGYQASGDRMLSAYRTFVDGQ